MDNVAPFLVDGVVKPIDLDDSQSSRTRESYSMAPKATVMAEVKAEEKAFSKSKPKSPPMSKEGADWNPEDFIRDAAWFATKYSLPNVGEIPHKILDISDEMLKECFGEKNRNGYKLSSCTGIPVEELLALLQVADGYDKPVNGVLSHTFAKGAYAKRMLKRKVNWASYAATKLKGQLSQSHRDGKPKSDGPPWIRKPVLYVPPTLEGCKKVVSTADLQISQVFKSEQLPTKMGEKSAAVDGDHSAPGCNDLSASLELSMYSAAPNAIMHNNSVNRSNSLELIGLIGKQVDKTKFCLLKVSEDRSKVEATVSMVNKQELGHTSAETALTLEIGRLEVEVIDLERKIQVEEDRVGEATIDIELESNKDTRGEETDKISGQLLTMMTEKLASHEKSVLNWKSLLSKAKSTLSSTKDQLDRHRLKHATLPRTVEKLKSVSQSLEVERVKTESFLNDQITEEKIVGRTLSKQCAPLYPVYVLTSTEAFLAQVTVSSCPLCCNGYHCNNWVPASCGHTYHPMCLFTHLTIEKSNAKCLACEELFSPDWLRSWGLEDTSWRDREDCTQHEGFVNQNEDIYGKDCNQLARRRQWVRNVANLHTQDDRDEMAAVSGLHSRVPSTMTEDEEGDLMVIENGSSMQPLLSPKIKGQTGKKPLGAKVGFVDRKLSSTPSSVGQHSSVVNQSEFSCLPLTPTATLPFPPETTIAFKPYKLVKTPTCIEPAIAKRRSRRVENSRKKQQLHFSD